MACIIAWPGYMGGFYYNSPANNTTISYFMRDLNLNLTIMTVTDDISAYSNRS